MKKIHPFARVTVAFTSALFGISGAHAALTSINNLAGGNGSERCLVGTGGVCSGGAYDGDYSIVHALEMDLNTSIVRVDDSFDQIWQQMREQGGQVMARARYASDTNQLGVTTGTSGYSNLIASTGDGLVRVSQTTLSANEYAADGNKSDFVAMSGGWTSFDLGHTGTDFAFLLQDKTPNPDYYWSSNNSGAGGPGSVGYNNSVNLDDHMVTFKVIDPNNAFHYIIAWEDRPNASADLDFNDFVAEVKFVAPVPVPAAAWLFGSALCGFAGMFRRRKH